MTAAEAQSPPERDSFAISYEAVEAVVQEANGNAIEAPRIMLREVVVMAADADAAVSFGFLRARSSLRARKFREVEA